jgi:hypothetical protein
MSGGNKSVGLKTETGSVPDLRFERPALQQQARARHFPHGWRRDQQQVAFEQKRFALGKDFGERGQHRRHQVRATILDDQLDTRIVEQPLVHILEQLRRLDHGGLDFDHRESLDVVSQHRPRSHAGAESDRHEPGQTHAEDGTQRIQSIEPRQASREGSAAGWPRPRSRATSHPSARSAQPAGQPAGGIGPHQPAEIDRHDRR